MTRGTRSFPWQSYFVASSHCWCVAASMSVYRGVEFAKAETEGWQTRPGLPHTAVRVDSLPNTITGVGQRQTPRSSNVQAGALAWIPERRYSIFGHSPSTSQLCRPRRITHRISVGSFPGCRFRVSRFLGCRKTGRSSVTLRGLVFAVFGFPGLSCMFWPLLCGALACDNIWAGM